MNNLMEDLSCISTIPYQVLNRLVAKCLDIICSNICETLLNKNNIAEIDIGLGNLYINLREDQVQYKFIPSTEMQNKVNKVIVDKIDPLQENIEQAIVKKIMTTYKDLF